MKQGLYGNNNSENKIISKVEAKQGREKKFFFSFIFANSTQESLLKATLKTKSAVCLRRMLDTGRVRCLQAQYHMVWIKWCPPMTLPTLQLRLAASGLV